MLGFLKKFVPGSHSSTPIYLHNTLTGEKQRFESYRKGSVVRMYNCGPTVYAEQHIGNLSMFVFTDVLRRAIEERGFEVKQVINFTDVGHLQGDNQGDADQGDDRMTKGLLREGLALTLENMKTLGKKYAEMFLTDLRHLGIDTERITFPYASDYIESEIAMVQALEEKGYAYVGTSGVYYDVSRFPEYGKLGNINLEGQKEGARVAASADKRGPHDFLLWKFDSNLGWDSPWGKGFPGWHIECSAMIRSILGEQIDIHTGGIEHIPVHHNNEIAQSEAATGKKPLSRFWLHRAHVQIDGGKIAKSEGNVVYLSQIIERGFHPLALRYLFLGAHYRTNANFSWEALTASQTALAKLLALRIELGDMIGTPAQQWMGAFNERIGDDLDTPGALAVLWDMTKDKTLAAPDLLAGMLEMDKVFGLNLKELDAQARALAATESSIEVALDDVAPEIRELIEKREAARAEKNWQHADELRVEIEHAGYSVEDTPEGPRLSK